MKFDGYVFEGEPSEMVEFYNLIKPNKKIVKENKDVFNSSTGTTQKLIDFFNNNIRMSLRAKEIEKAVGMKQGTYSPVLSRLVEKKFIERVEQGLYYIPRFIDYKGKHYRVRKKREHKKWDSIQDTNLKNYVKDGLPINDIADKMGRTHDSIYSRLKKLNDGKVVYPSQSYYLKGGDHK